MWNRSLIAAFLSTVYLCHASIPCCQLKSVSPSPWRHPGPAESSRKPCSSCNKEAKQRQRDRLAGFRWSVGWVEDTFVDWQGVGVAPLGELRSVLCRANARPRTPVPHRHRWPLAEHHKERIMPAARLTWITERSGGNERLGLGVLLVDDTDSTPV